MPARSRRRALAVCAAVAVAVSVPASSADARPGGSAIAVTLSAQQASGGAIPRQFVGLSIEWSLVERYMGPSAQPAFVNLLRNLGSGVLRIGGSSQDVMPFDPSAPNTDEVITPQDLSYIRTTLDRAGGANAWRTALGTAMSPPSASRPFVSPEHAHAFVTQGVAPAFPGAAAREVAGIELGNEPDLSYGSNLDRYLGDLTTYSDPNVSGPWPVIAPNTSEDILPWESIDGRTVPTRYFWNWPQILDTVGSAMRGGYSSDHFYPLARTCTNKPYRCPSVGALLSDEHMDSLDYQVYVHAQQAAQHGVGYRLEETNTAAGRGADGVSNVAASATYALDLMFHVACPQPPNAPAANSGCDIGARGLNFHNAEVRAFFHPEEGNAYYNAIDYDPTDAMGPPTAAPLYYALLLFGRFAQGTDGLRPVAMPGAGVKAWSVDVGPRGRRMFLINKGDQPAVVSIATPAPVALIDRMTPYDPTGAGKTLDASEVRIDGQQVRADGVWPGFRPDAQRTSHGQLSVSLGAGEAAVITIHSS